MEEAAGAEEAERSEDLAVGVGRRHDIDGGVQAPLDEALDGVADGSGEPRAAVCRAAAGPGLELVMARARRPPLVPDVVLDGPQQRLDLLALGVLALRQP